MRLLRRYRQFAATLAIAAILFGALAGAFARMPAGSNIVDSVLGVVLMCKGAGTGDTDGGTRSDCPVCLLTASMALVGVMLALTLATPPAPLDFVPVRVRTDGRRQRRGTLGSRAPPIF